MRNLARILFAAVVLSAALASCTSPSSGGATFIPATHQTRPLDSGGGLPPKPAPTP